MWDERYSAKEYVYGTQPNDFLKHHVNTINNGNVLSLAEGEGRNAVFLAKMGYSVTAVDSSIAGILKGKQLAQKNNVKINFVHADITEYDLGHTQWDGIISIFFPLASKQRRQLYKKIPHALKINGVFLLEAYTPEQIQYGTGGGNDIDTMQSKKTLSTELASLTFDHLIEINRNVIEGKLHTGMGSVVQAIATKKS